MSLLHIGDIISLYADGFLSTLGLVDDRCVLRPTRENCPKKFRDCLFKVCIQYKYDIQSELWRSNNHIDDELYKKLYAAAKCEQDSNQEKNQSRRGQVIKYEDTIQLLHIKSNKFITVNPKSEALEEKDATRVYLDLNGNEGSWFKVRSPYKYRSNGEDVVCESIALVSDLMRVIGHEEPIYLHASNLYLLDNPECLEINASRNTSSWELKLFLDHTEDVEDFLKGGDVVRLFHTGQDKFLTLDTYDQTQHVFLRHTDREKATTATSSKALWEVEVVHQDPCRSSLARWNSLIRLKHLATERFLAADQDDDTTIDATREKLRQKFAPVYKLISIEYSYDFATLFEFDSTNSNVDRDDCIPIHSNVSLKHHPTGTYVHSTNIIIDEKAPLDKGKSCMSKLGCAQMKSLDEVFLVKSVPATEVRDLDFVYDACIILHETIESIKHQESEGRNDALKKLSELLPEIVYFIANKKEIPKLDKALTIAVDNPDRERQKLLREQDVLKLLFEILSMKDKFNLSQIICKLCYRVIMLSFKGYRKNQVYIVRWSEFMQSQFGMEIMAEACYSALFHSHKDLLEDNVKPKDIEIFINLIRKHRRAEYLDCLADLCITDKNFVCSKNQKLICDYLLIEKNADILLETCTNQNGHSILLSTSHWCNNTTMISGENHHHQRYQDNNYSSSFPIEMKCYTKPLAEIVIGALNGYSMDSFLLDYYRHQLDLFSAMCTSRQYVAIDILSQRMPIHLMQNCISDDQLPSDLRASFCRLMLHLHIIRDPQKYMTPVNLNRSYNSIPVNQVNIENYNNINQEQIDLVTSNNDSFNETMQFVEIYLQDLTESPYRGSSIFSNNSRDMLTFEVINLNRELTYFGFYRLEDFLRLSRMLLIVLEDSKNQQQLVMKTKIKIIETLHHISEVQLDYMITSLLSLFRLNQTDSGKSEADSNGQSLRKRSGLMGSENPIDFLRSLGPLNSAHTLAMKTNQALNKRIQEINLDCNHGKKFVDVLLHLVKHDCPELVTTSLKLLLKYRSLRQRILETFKRVELSDASPHIREDFRKIHPLIERSDKYIRRGHDDNHAFVSQCLLENAHLISYIVQHIQYMIRNEDEKDFTRDLLLLLRELIPLDDITGSVGNQGISVHGSGSPIINNNNKNNKNNNIDSNNSNSTNNNSKKGGSPSTLSLTDIQVKLDTYGVSNLVIELIAMGSTKNDQKIYRRCALIFKHTLALGIALLEGGNPQVQASINDRLTKKGEKSERFFQVISDRIGAAQQALSPKQINTTQLPENIKVMQPVLRLLQLLCEDHNMKMQRYMHSQKNNNSFNIVAKTLVFLNCICGSKEGSLGYKLGEYIVESNVDLINQTLRTLTEFCQGPCIENQRCILMHESNGIDMIRSLILDKIEPLDSLRMDRVLELKDNASKLLLALMESCSDPRHAQRILREPSLTRKLIDVAIAYYHEQEDYDDIFAEFSCEEMVSSTDGMVRPRDVGHKVFILCLQLVQQYNQAQEESESHLVARMPTSEEASIIANRCDSPKRDWYLREAAALAHYETNTAQIEIVRSDRQIERVVFPIPQICEYLTLETKRSIYQDTEPDEHDSKIPAFFQKIDALFDEMKWQRELHTKPILHSIARHMSLCSSIEFRLSCLVTILVLLCVSPRAPTVIPGESIPLSSDINDDDINDNINDSTNVLATNINQAQGSTYTPSSGSQLTSGNSTSIPPGFISSIVAIGVSTLFFFKIKLPYSWTLVLLSLTFMLGEMFGKCSTLIILGLVLELVSLLHLSSVLINKGIINKPLHHILYEPDVLYHGGHLLVCTLGILVSPLFYPFWLPLSLIRREETLRNVIKSVTKNAYSILMTGFLGLIIILLYTIINYLLLGHDLVIELDDGSIYKPCLGTVGECYIAHVNYGLRSGGGVGERIRDTPLDLSIFSFVKFASILSFFLVVNLMILQLVFGIVIDTFGALRDEKQNKEKILKDTCFVCGLDRSVFENQTPTFEDHIRFEHNLWHYLYFIVLIKTKSRTELNGPESFVYDKNNDHSWFPRKRALGLKLD